MLSYITAFMRETDWEDMHDMDTAIKYRGLFCREVVKCE